MEHRPLGRTGVSVSKLCLGAMMFGDWGTSDHDQSIRIIHRALDAGINFIDTADAYSAGESEEIVGKALAGGRRDDIVLATKVWFPMGEDANRRGASRRWIIREVEDSLRRLGTDWIDLYQIHRYDPGTDIEETLGALTDLVHQGKVRYLGSSTFPPSAIVAAQWTARDRHLQRFVCDPQQRQANLAAAAAAAQRARTAVVFAYMEGTEGVDQPTLALPDEQDQLIEAVARANPRTVVVLNSGYPVLMPWVKQVRAILDMWYPGQEGGRATADLLLGAAVPGGKLPVTFPAREADAPTATSPLRYPGVNGQEYYSEGIFVGYRWYDQQRIAPLYPFGYGLSYTRFGYRNLRILPGHHGALPRVRFTVTNTGSRAGTEVAQVYVGRLPTSLPTPVKQLAGVARVTLRPGERRTLTVSLDRLSLSYWDTAADRWVTPTGQVTVLVGSSSRNIQLRGTLTIRHQHG